VIIFHTCRSVRKSKIGTGRLVGTVGAGISTVRTVAAIAPSDLDHCEFLGRGRCAT
jgi:hypothetical protein